MKTSMRYATAWVILALCGCGNTDPAAQPTQMERAPQAQVTDDAAEVSDSPHGTQGIVFHAGADFAFTATDEALMGVRLFIPAGTFDADMVELRLTRRNDVHVGPVQSAPGLVLAGMVVEIAALDAESGASLEPSGPLTLTLPYSATDDGRTLEEFEIAHIGVMSDPLHEAVALESTLTSYTVSADITTLGEFAAGTDFQAPFTPFNAELQPEACTNEVRDSDDNLLIGVTFHFDASGRFLSQTKTTYNPSPTTEITSAIYDASDRITQVVRPQTYLKLLYDGATGDVTYSARYDQTGELNRTSVRSYNDGILDRQIYDYAPLGSPDATMVFSTNSLGMYTGYVYTQGAFLGSAWFAYDLEGRLTSFDRRNEAITVPDTQECLYSRLTWQSNTVADVAEYMDDCEGGPVTDDERRITYYNCSAQFVYWYFTYFELDAY